MAKQFDESYLTVLIQITTVADRHIAVAFKPLHTLMRRAVKKTYKAASTCEPKTNCVSVSELFQGF